jgi:hypothetical protein
VRTTVLIPLHASERWLPVVTGNIERLAPHARLMVSDATGLDDALPRLRERLGDLTEIEWLGPRPLPPGWVAHCNDLVERASSELAMWLPHDDDVDPPWVSLGERALDADPAAVLALGSVRSLERDERGVDDRAVPSRNVLDPHPPFLAGDPAERVREALQICLHGRRGLLGMAFRGVFRRASAVPLPDVRQSGAWADVLWAIEMLGVGRFAATEAVYWKRWYAGNTHGGWADPRTEPLFRAELLPAALAPLPPGDRLRVTGSAWAADASWYEARIAELEAQQVSMRGEVAALRERVGELRRRLRRIRRGVAS